MNRQTGGLTFTGHYTPVGNPSIIVFLDLGKAQSKPFPAVGRHGAYRFRQGTDPWPGLDPPQPLASRLQHSAFIIQRSNHTTSGTANGTRGVHVNRASASGQPTNFSVVPSNLSFGPSW